MDKDQQMNNQDFDNIIVDNAITLQQKIELEFLTKWVDILKPQLKKMMEEIPVGSLEDESGLIEIVAFLAMDDDANINDFLTEPMS